MASQQSLDFKSVKGELRVSGGGLGMPGYLWANLANLLTTKDKDDFLF